MHSVGESRHPHVIAPRPSSEFGGRIPHREVHVARNPSIEIICYISGYKRLSSKRSRSRPPSREENAPAYPAWRLADRQLARRGHERRSARGLVVEGRTFT